MKTTVYKYCLFMVTNLATGMLMAQSVNNSPVAFKEIQKKWATDNFTIREIKTKELQIAPSKIVLLNMNNTPAITKEKSSKKKKIN